MADERASKGRVRRWWERRRDRRARSGEMSRRAHDVRTETVEQIAKQGTSGANNPGPFVGP